MRTLEQARSSWEKLEPLSSFQAYKDAVRQPYTETTLPSRSIYWKVFLLFQGADHSQWLRRLGDSRSAYVSLRTHLLRGVHHSDELDIDLDPLSEDTESPWNTLRNDELLRAEILQDVDRCMPENTFFRQQDTQDMMVDILSIFCKLNPDVSYRQGMHELLAPILWVIQSDAVRNGSSADDFFLCQICDSRFIEHDAFTLFSIMMQNAKSFYEQSAHRGQTALSQKQSAPALENPIVTRIHRIFDDYLPQIDPEVASHLHSIDIIPQVFLMRYIRLLFGREFPLDDVLSMWDVIFAEDPSLEVVDIICLTMLLRIRWELLEADYNTALTLLLRYPVPTDGLTPQTLAIDAIDLKNDFTRTRAHSLIKRYTNRETPQDTTLPDPEDFALEDRPQPAPVRRRVTPSLPRNFESIFQDAAKGVITRGEKWGINKAVRDAVGEVQSSIRNINIATPQAPPRRYSRGTSRASFSQHTSPHADPNASVAGTRQRSEGRLVGLQQRNESLARMLKQATAQLWEFQRKAAEGEGLDKEGVKGLSMAIARVQFVQVYLEDPSIPLAAEEVDEGKTGDGAGNAQVGQQGEGVEGAPSGDNKESFPLAEDAEQVGSVQDQAPAVAVPVAESRPADRTLEHQATQSQPSPLSASRPKLAQSSFSWMLGQEERPSSFMSSRAEAADKVKGRGFLFGDEAEAGEQEATAAKPEGRAKRKERKVVRMGMQQEEDDGFDMSTLKQG